MDKREKRMEVDGPVGGAFRVRNEKIVRSTFEKIPDLLEKILDKRKKAETFA